MRLGRTAPLADGFDAPPPWPPLLAARGPGTRSSGHSHHAMHLVLALEGTLSIRVGRKTHRSAGVLTAPDLPHALDGSGREVLLVFLDPESDVGEALGAAVAGGLRLITSSERDRLLGAADPLEIMRAGGVPWTREAARILGGGAPPRRLLHPRVRRLLALLQDLPPGSDASLEALAAQVGLSPGRLMHAFTASVGIPLRRYLAWLRLQRAAAAIVGGRPLGEAAALAGFSDAAHMSRTFRAMLGMPPSTLRRS
jgi:AraC-like DNA-binding protein